VRERRSPVVSERRLAVAAGLDAASIVLFAAIGVRNHEIDSGFGDVATIAAPFLIGLAVGWIAGRAWERPFAFRTGLIAWLATIVVGMLLRNVVFDRGTAASFVIVAILFIGACLLGWRLVARLVTRRTDAPAATSHASPTGTSSDLRG
jgi:hypothetical protein